MPMSLKIISSLCACFTYFVFTINATFSMLRRVAVNSTQGQLDTCVELTHLQKSQLDTSQLDTGVNSTHGQLDTHKVNFKTHTQQFNCRKAVVDLLILEGRLNRRRSSACILSCKSPFSRSLLCSYPAIDQVDGSTCDATARLFR